MQKYLNRPMATFKISILLVASTVV